MRRYQVLVAEEGTKAACSPDAPGSGQSTLENAGTSEPLLWIGGVPRAKSPDSYVFEVEVSETSDLPLDDIPEASTIEICGLPGSLDDRRGGVIHLMNTATLT